MCYISFFNCLLISHETKIKKNIEIINANVFTTNSAELTSRNGRGIRAIIKSNTASLKAILPILGSNGLLNKKRGIKLCVGKS